MAISEQLGTGIVKSVTELGKNSMNKLKIVTFLAVS